MVLRLEAVVVPTLKSLQSKGPRASNSTNKRKRDSVDRGCDSGAGSWSAKRRSPATPGEFWTPPTEFLEREGPELVLAGETPEDDDETDFRIDQKTVRKLRDFVFFDTRDGNVMVPLDAIEKDGFRHVEAAGFVSPCFESDEDEGDEELNLERFVALGAVFRFWLDYTVENGALWIETEFSWYILEEPSTAYAEIHNNFTKPYRIAQIALSSAIQDQNEDYEVFVQRLRSQNGWNENDLWDSSSTIQDALGTQDPQITSSVLSRLFPNKSRKPFSRKRRSPPRFRHRGSTDIDARKQINATTVTPLIAALVEGLVREVLQVIGKKSPSKGRPNRFQQDELPRLLANARDDSRVVRFSEEDALDADDGFYSRVTVGQEKFKVGDVILTPRYLDDDEKPVEPHHLFADHFWFGKIIHIDAVEGKAHIQWLNHGSHVDIGEIAHPYELFIDRTCTDLPLTQLAGRVAVDFIPGVEEIPNNKFFVRYCTQSTSNRTATSSPCITSLNPETLELASTLSLIPPPENCPVCVHNGQRREEGEVTKVIQGGHGFAYQGRSFHLHDFVLYASDAGPANIGQIVKIYHSDADVSRLKLVQLGRIRDVVGVPSESIIDSERHLFVTPITEKIRPTAIVRPCYMFPHRGLSEGSLEDWLRLSPYHFFIKHSFPTRDRPFWRARSLLGHSLSCKECVEKAVRMFGEHSDFVATRKGNKLSMLDLFGGCGALGLGLAEGSQALEVTHAIEILPSSAKTYQRNSPSTKVYNQCVNTMLKYAIKEHSGHFPHPPKQLFDDTVDVPPPPKPGDVDVVVAGFPCQTFSHLNRFKQAGNVKSNLILNALSWIDFLNPKFCLFENVPAFKDEKLSIPRSQRTDNQQSDIEGGYFKLLLRALLDMGYQVRHGILQAGEFGTPQSRSRFFLIAAKRGLDLPELPSPTHFFPTNRNSSVPFRLPHHSVTVNDAIDDLPPFDWKDPDDADNREYDNRDGRHIPILESTGDRCGFEGAVGYDRPTPRTRFQKQARRNPTTDLQHFTKVLKREHIRRTVNIPMTPGGDYRGLNPSFGSYELSNPCSAMGRKGYLPGLFGRLDGDYHFPTTVTNIGPTAKQSRVLHPYCKRMVSVRELARSQGFPDDFVFVAVDGKPVTHREIGNAVPFPLSMAIGAEFLKVLREQWSRNRITIDDSDDDM